MNDGAALLGGLLIGGLVVGAAMSADNDAERRRNQRNCQYRQQHVLCPYCICGAKMVQGCIKQGVAKCNNLNCQRVLTGSTCYYCPNGGNVQQHRNGFFYCQQCAVAVSGTKAQVVQAKPVVSVQQQRNLYPAQQRGSQKAVVVKQGYMSKKGSWLNTGYKKRWFKLWSNRKMAYLTHPGASYTKGYADFTAIKRMEKKGKHGFEVHTTEREWSFLCQSEAERNSWFLTIQTTCTNVKPQVQYAVQQPVQYAPKPQVKYVQPQPQYVPAPQPQVAKPYVPAPQPQYAKPYVPNNNNNANQALQPGMTGYNVGNMYANNANNKNAKSWESNAPPPAYSSAYPPLAASAPPEDDIVPSAPPAEDQNEGMYTGK
eukprot:215887_1